MTEFERGDRVEWNAHGGKRKPSGKAVGRVVRKLTSRTKVGGHVAEASPHRPQFLVESEKSGGRAAHHPEALRRRDD